MQVHQYGKRATLVRNVEDAEALHGGGGREGVMWDSVFYSVLL